MAFSTGARSRRVLLACDKFKGTLTSMQVAEALTAGLTSTPASLVEPEVSVVALPVADGGDGSLDIALRSGAAQIEIVAENAWGRSRTVPVALQDGTATIEVALICGLGAAVPTAEDALRASTFGVGRAVRAVLDGGATRIVLAVGGTSTSDGGAGMLQALGARVLDVDGVDVGPGGGALGRAVSLDLGGLDRRLAEVDFLLATDVDNLLLGPAGAASVYGPQKGATPPAVRILESGLTRWAALAGAIGGVPGADRLPGAGAGGGLGFAAILLGGRVVPGAEYFLEQAGLAREIERADLVVTGEGRLDAQTLRGKAPGVVARVAASAGIPVVGVVGATTLARRTWQEAGFRDLYALVDRDPRCAGSGDISRAVLSTIGRELRENLANLAEHGTVSPNTGSCGGRET